VLFRLDQLGVMSSLAPRNSPDVDVLAFVQGTATTSAEIQVKTRTRGPDGGWPTGKKHENIVRPSLFYVFVDLEPSAPTSFVVPSGVVADVVRRSHAAWLATPGKNGRAHQDTDMRRVIPEYSFAVSGYQAGWMEQYRERWDLIAQRSESAA
jgi:hypothetical protein